MDLGTAFNGIAAMGSVAALILSLILTQKVISQTDRVSNEAQKLASEQHVNERFDAIFAAVEKMLETLSDLKVDARAYRNSTNLIAGGATTSAGEDSARIGRDLEHFQTRILFLNAILVGLPEVSREPSTLEKLREAGSRVENAKSWLAATAMYYATSIQKPVNTSPETLERQKVAIHRILRQLAESDNLKPITSAHFTKVDESFEKLRYAATPNKDYSAKIALDHLDVALALFIESFTQLALIYQRSRNESFSS